MADESVDAATVQHYKRLFAEEEASPNPFAAVSPVDKTVFDRAFEWTDVVDAAVSTNTCDPTCYTCPADCNVACCMGRGNVTLSMPVPTKDDSKPASHRILPSPLACPCYCGVNCPPQIADICCVTAGGEKVAAVEGDADSQKQKQKPLGGTTTDGDADTDNTLHEDFPGRTQDCPCHCETSCPGNIQAVCCVTAGSGDDDAAAAAADNNDEDVSGASTTTTDSDSQTASTVADGGGQTASSSSSAPAQKRKAQKQTQTPAQTYLGLVMQTASGDPVSVLMAVNLTVDQCFITLELVRGLERTGEIVFVETGHFEIVLGVAVSYAAGDKAKAKVLTQNFQVIDGSKLWEREQVLLGLGFMARFGGLSVDAGVLAEVVGLPVMTGMRTA